MTKLRQCGNKWNFHNELELEEFVWTHLKSSLELSPLKRQYSIKGQFCDILAISLDNQLVVIELKNEVDRYVVQQLTRYYHALQQERPFSDRIDYSKPVRLVAIAPSFHPDNLIDQQYNRLSVEFLQFEILPDASGFVWQLQDLESQQTWCLRLPIATQNSTWDVPPVPRKLLNNLADVDENQRSRILHVRQTLLEFDERVKETVRSSYLSYGKGKTRSCAELRFGSPSYSLSQPKMLNLLLWLPHPDRKQVCRMAISTQDWMRVERLYYCPASSRRVHGGNDYWSTPAGLLKAFREWGGETEAFGIRYYSKLLDQPNRASSLNLWVEIALERWLERL